MRVIRFLLTSLLFTNVLGSALILRQPDHDIAARQTTNDFIPAQWIGSFKSGCLNPFALIVQLVEALLGDALLQTFNSPVFQGFTIRLSKIQRPDLFGALQSSLFCLNIEQDQRVTVPKPGTPSRRAIVTQQNAPWGLTRISHRKLGNLNAGYVRDDKDGGAGITVYILDTGINAQHTDFTGRIETGYNAVDKSTNTKDGNGHGTHVAGTIGGKTYGISKRATLIPIKIFTDSGTGSISTVLAGLDWAVKNMNAHNRKNKSIANMSLGGGKSSALNEAVSNAVKAGLFMAVAAGNDGKDATDYSPASAPEACTVGATDKTDTRAPFSNYGSDLDIYAPGTNILSAWIGSNTASNTISGTSMACPHIAGLAAYFWGNGNQLTAGQMCQFIRSKVNNDIVVKDGRSAPNNKVAYNNNGA